MNLPSIVSFIRLPTTFNTHIHSFQEGRGSINYAKDPTKHSSTQKSSHGCSTSGGRGSLKCNAKYK